MTYARTFAVNLGTARTGLAGTLTYNLKKTDDTDLVAATAVGILETPAGSGSYRVTVAAFDSAWVGYIIWNVPGVLGVLEDFGPAQKVQDITNLTTGQITGTVAVGTSTTVFTGTGALLSSVDGAYGNATGGMLLSFTSGPNAGLCHEIANYVGATKQFTLKTGALVTPASPDTFVLGGAWGTW